MTQTFQDLGLSAELNTALARMNYTTPTPIQAKAIPLAVGGRDILGSAQTGTGKTAAFTIPMVEKLVNNPSACAIILTPTRELAAQVLSVVHQLANRSSGIRTALLIGGESMGKQFAQLKGQPRIIVGTPGRINDHLSRNSRLFQDVNFVVLDEADRMLDMGFAGQIDDVLKHVRKERQTLMFSATFPEKILKFARTYLNNPARVEIESPTVSAANIQHDLVETTHENKFQALLAEITARSGSIVVFVKTKHGADRMAGRLEKQGIDAGALHGGLNQRQRDRAIRSFRAQEYRVMVATDVAARGMDIPHIEHVINYDLPMVAEDYIHRIGRTARAGAKGHAMAFITPDDKRLWADIHAVMYPGEARPKADRPQGDFRNGGNRKGGKPSRFKNRFRKGGGKDHRGQRRDENRSDNRPENRQENRQFGQDKPRYEGRHQDRNEGQRQDRPRFDGQRNDRHANRGPRPERQGQDRYKPRQDGPRQDGQHRDGQRQDRPHHEARRFDGDRQEGRRSDENRHDRQAARGARPHGQRRDYKKDGNRGNRDNRGFQAKRNAA